MRYLVAPLLALVCAISTVVPAAARPDPTATVVLTCERGAGATAQVLLYQSGNIVGTAYNLSCGLASPTGARSQRVRVPVVAKPDTVGYQVQLAYPGQPQPGCNVFTQFPSSVSCPVENWTGPAVTMAAR